MRSTEPIRWKMKFRSAPDSVYAMLATDEGRARFWGESSTHIAGGFRLSFPMDIEMDVRLLQADPPRLFKVDYFGMATTFELAQAEDGGTDLTLTAECTDPDDWNDVHAGWVSVLMALKAAVDHDVDLRNHDGARTWAQGYADN